MTLRLSSSAAAAALLLCLAGTTQAQEAPKPAAEMQAVLDKLQALDANGRSDLAVWRRRLSSSLRSIH
jgi:hypothetical protein